MNCYVAKVFDNHISYVINKNIFVWLFIYLDFIWMKAFYIDCAIKKVVCTIFNINLFHNICFILIWQIVFLYPVSGIIVIKANGNDNL